MDNCYYFYNLITKLLFFDKAFTISNTLVTPTRNNLSSESAAIMKNDKSNKCVCVCVCVCVGEREREGGERIYWIWSSFSRLEDNLRYTCNTF